jgi:hypothetical protein
MTAPTPTPTDIPTALAVTNGHAVAAARLRRRSTIGALPVVVMVLAWRARPGHYGFDAVRLPGRDVVRGAGMAPVVRP